MSLLKCLTLLDRSYNSSRTYTTYALFSLLVLLVYIYAQFFVWYNRTLISGHAYYIQTKNTMILPLRSDYVLIEN